MTDVFTHIGKTGGTTLSTTLRWVYGPSSCYQIPAGRPEQPERWFDDVSKKRVDKVRLVMGHATYGVHEQISGPSRYFTMLRHPIRRVVSLYYYIKSGWPESEVASMSLEEFVHSDHRAARPNDQVRFVSGEKPENAPKKALRDAKRNLKENFAAVGITERFDESLLLLQRKLGWSRPPVYVSSNVNRERPTVEELPSSTVDVVRRQNELDLELYRVAFDDFQERLSAEIPDLEHKLNRLDRMNRLVDVVGPPFLGMYRTARSVMEAIVPTDR